jgi:gamma-glutamylcyclotransferase (GGCT)/AIG2-like uncharacterized protein YtfP
MNKYYLFSYGTLMNKEVQRVLFGHEIKMENAILENWKVYADIDGYFYVKEEEYSLVEGNVLELTEEELWIADQWEEVPTSMYLRRRVYVKLYSGEAKEVFIYEKMNVKAAKEVNQGSIASMEISEVLDTVREFKKQLDDNIAQN